LGCSVLDAPEIYRELDPAGMGQHISGLPEQCREAWERAQEFSLPPDYRDFDRITLSGMGGSAIGGDLLQGLCAAEGVAVEVYRDYSPPPSQDGRTLSIFCSHSGKTEETVSAFEASLNTPSKKLAVTGGGRLAELAREQGIPVFTIACPAPPRASLGYTFVALVGLVQKAGLLKDKSEEMAGAIRTLEGMRERLGPEVPAEANAAKRLARLLQGKFPVIYGAGFLSGVARRWKTQINENGKAWAFFDLLPELNHNSVVGFRLPAELLSGLYVIFLASPLLHPRVRLRYDLTTRLLQEAGVAYWVCEGEGEGLLSQMMSLIYLGDWVSYYLAMLYRVDPSPTPAIDFLKAELSRHSEA